MNGLIQIAYCTVRLYKLITNRAQNLTAYTKHGNCRSRVEALSLGPSATQQGGVGNVIVGGIAAQYECHGLLYGTTVQ